MADQQPYRGNPNASQASRYGGIPYTPPERVESKMDDEVVPFSRTGRAWRLVLAVALAVLGIADLALVIVTLASADALGQAATAVGVVGPGILAALLLIYPVVTVIRLRHHTL